MGEIVNLRKARKAKARAEAAAEAAARRALHGRTAAESQRQRKDRALAQRKLDGALRADQD